MQAVISSISPLIAGNTTENKMSNYPDDIRQYDDHPDSPFYDDKGRSSRIQDICVEIIDGNHEYSVEDVVSEVIYEDDALLARYKQGLQDIALGSTCGYELHMVINDAIEIMAARIVDKELSK